MRVRPLAVILFAAGDRLTWHMADNVNDFAWATARNFVWQATRATHPGQEHTHSAERCYPKVFQEIGPSQASKWLEVDATGTVCQAVRQGGPGQGQPNSARVADNQVGPFHRA